mmetsp:Transcript_114632/g.309616  ORF Transcript_114632/g.309616 Transcript_114632/m.309616 type:complete len:485 (-) Transcript_114632:129-1583(-)
MHGAGSSLRGCLLVPTLGAALPCGPGYADPASSDRRRLLLLLILLTLLLPVVVQGHGRPLPRRLLRGLVPIIIAAVLLRPELLPTGQQRSLAAIFRRLFLIRLSLLTPLGLERLREAELAVLLRPLALQPGQWICGFALLATLLALASLALALALAFDLPGAIALLLLVVLPLLSQANICGTEAVVIREEQEVHFGSDLQVKTLRHLPPIQVDLVLVLQALPEVAFRGDPAEEALPLGDAALHSSLRQDWGAVGSSGFGLGARLGLVLVVLGGGLVGGLLVAGISAPGLLPRGLLGVPVPPIPLLVGSVVVLLPTLKRRGLAPQAPCSGARGTFAADGRADGRAGVLPRGLLGEPMPIVEALVVLAPDLRPTRRQWGPASGVSLVGGPSSGQVALGQRADVAGAEAADVLVEHEVDVRAHLQWLPSAHVVQIDIDAAAPHFGLRVRDGLKRHSPTKPVRVPLVDAAQNSAVAHQRSARCGALGY